jgi:hypothetical protein
VYIVQDNPKHAFWPAQEYGELRYCLTTMGDYYYEQVTPRLRTKLRDFDADNDYLCFSGAPLACAIALAILHERFDRVQVLRWSNQKQEYEKLVVDLMANEETTDG